ncbi:orotidine-5'-phosphate decarboxylase [Alkalicoccus daliensis]|uniref:Orotidine 5'-phosphate decarboxylase n=1 Tax=Alkalicoccus daliensis TaxID=745820 RepID=A0A1G9ZXJ1_9BACI|nr:orotidine-5'-phosphate decarboxylase [Alkalicoccus daliensis]SDN25804.1 orotidine-5'-phosphate decarboxylase [Alkalicoccus daliensis]
MADKPLIIALDKENKHAAEKLLTSFGKESLYVKVGMELYFREGRPMLEYLKENGHRIFLDLKLHDIPTTVFKAMKQLAEFEVDMVNVHALGGKKMMEAALEGLTAGTADTRTRPKLIAVTQLTSTTEKQLQEEQASRLGINEAVLSLASLAKEAGMDGVVCSALEAADIKKLCGNEFQCVTPGIRLKEDEANDQIRIVTPADAAANGADAIVVGRGITSKSNPLSAYFTYKKEWESAWTQQ